MNLSEAIKIIGRTGTIRTAEGMTIEVFVNDVKSVYGVTRYEVSPVAGDGRAWINADRFTPGTEAE